MKSMDLEKLSELLRNKKEEATHNISFLEAIDHSTDENLISKYLLFLFTHNLSLINSLLRNCYKERFVDLERLDSGITEYSISESKRIDLLFEGEDIENQKVLIVIENKIYSHEHSSQCQKYYAYCSKKYKDYRQYYLFLYPDFNLGNQTLSDKHFIKITYADLLKALNSLENRTIYEQDFINLINNQLRSTPMDEIRTFFINHFDEIKTEVKKMDDNLDNFFSEFKERFLEEHKELTSEFMDRHRTLRFYKDIPTWWNGWKVTNEERIYFYLELKCEDNLKFYVQRTLKVYSKDLNTKINHYLQLTGTPLIIHKYMDTFKVFDRVELKSDHPILSNEWKLDIFNKATEILEKLEQKQEEEAQRYAAFE